MGHGWFAGLFGNEYRATDIRNSLFECSHAGPELFAITDPTRRCSEGGLLFFQGQGPLHNVQTMRSSFRFGDRPRQMFFAELPLLNIMRTGVKRDVFMKRSSPWMIVAVNFDEPLLGHMGINLGCGDIGVAEHHLHSA